MLADLPPTSSDTSSTHAEVSDETHTHHAHERHPLLDLDALADVALDVHLS